MADYALSKNKKQQKMIKRIAITSVFLCMFQLFGCTDQASIDSITILKAKEVITLETATGNAVAFKGDRIVAVGDINELIKTISISYPNDVIEINDQFEEAVFVPGFINQHDHPWLGAITLSSNVVSFEEWILPHRTYPAATSAQAYQDQLQVLLSEHKNKDALFLSWGYHKLWHGELNRALLDDISTETPHCHLAAFCTRIHF